MRGAVYCFPYTQPAVWSLADVQKRFCGVLDHQPKTVRAVS